MDANGLRCFGLTYGAGLYGWDLPIDPNAPVGADAKPQLALSVEAADGHLVTSVRLASRAPAMRLAEVRNDAAAVALEPAMAIDVATNFVFWDKAAGQLKSVSHLAAQHPELEPIALELPAQAQPVADLAVGDDDVLYVAGGGGLWLIDLRARFDATRVDAADASFVPHKLASIPGGGVAAMDVSNGRMARFSGLPLATTGIDLMREIDDRFDSRDRNPNPPQLRVLPATFDVDERPIGIASSGSGCVVVLTLGRAAGGARIRMVLDDGSLSPAVRLEGPRFPHTVAWLDAEHLALATQGSIASDAGAAPRDPGVFVYPFPAGLRARLAAAASVPPADAFDPVPALGDFYPLTNFSGGPFVNARPGGRLHYPRLRGAATEPAPVARISVAARSAHGVVANFPAESVPNARILSAVGLIDTKRPSTIWHRLYAEACMPPGAAMIVWLTANEGGPPAFDPQAPTQRAGWHPHLVGDSRALPADVAAALDSDTPHAVWVRDASEVPFGESLLTCERQPDRSGLFTALIQRAGLTVRSLQGARLWAVVEMFGDSRATPELIALRAYSGRKSYRDQYLPTLYHETVFGEEADRNGRATGADFLERFLDLFEGPFTAIEDRIAMAFLATDTFACPPEALPWLGSWIGVALDPGTPTERSRWMIANAPRLAQRHGTLEGLQLALDIATDGGVTKGRIVVVENWRLRRTLATIVGASFVDADDPLTAGIAQSGNSFVGDTLFLGDENAKTFLALFRDLQVDPSVSSYEAQQQRDERDAAIHALYDGLAYRVTVLVHEAASDDELRAVKRLSQTSAPAHVLVNVATAQYPFMVGVASLIGADTFLRAPPATQPVLVDTSRLGYVDTLQGLGSLDAHGGGFDGVLPALHARVAPPRARVRVDSAPSSGQPFTLDGSGSTAAPGHTIEEYLWIHTPPE